MNGADLWETLATLETCCSFSRRRKEKRGKRRLFFCD